MRVGGLLLDAVLKQDSLNRRRVVLASPIGSQNLGETAGSSEGLLQKRRELILRFVKKDHDVPRVADGEDGNVAMPCGREVVLAHVNQIDVPSSLARGSGGRRGVATYDVGVLTVVAGLARIRDGAENADAVFAELGDLGDIRVTQTKMPEFRLRQHARVQRSLL
jgi:hypothetical protein